MNAEQIRARLAAIAARLEEVQASEEGYTEEQMTEIETLNTEFKGLNSQLETAEKVESMKATASASAGRKTAPVAAKEPVRVEVGQQRNARFGGFDSTSAWIKAVKEAGVTGQPDKRLLQASLSQEKSAEDGGFLVPEEMAEGIQKKIASGDDSLMAKANVIPVSGNSLTLNVDENAPWSGGIQCYWTAEGAQATGSKPSFKQAAWRLQKITALVTATDELLEDAVALGGYIQNSAPEAFTHKINSAILTGNGSGKPQGIINSPFAYTVVKETQSVDTIVARNVLKMYARLLPTSLGKSAWYVNPACIEQLLQLVDDNGNFMYISPGGLGNQLATSPFGTLLGRPVIPMMGSMPALGDLGDIILADMSYYWMIRKAAGVKSATSIHMNFDKEETAFRFSMRLDGRCPFQAPVTTEFGSYSVSAFVLLQAR